MINWCGLHQDYLVPGEMEIIVDLIKATPAQTMIEVGCRDGRTAKVLLHNVTTLQRYIGVDVPMSYIPTLVHQRSEMVDAPGALALDDIRFELVLRKRGSLDLGPQSLPSCDAMFIDGDHSEQVVEHDSHLARALVKSGGVIIWHDYFNGAVEVTRVLTKLRSQDWPIVHIPGTWLGKMVIQ